MSPPLGSSQGQTLLVAERCGHASIGRISAARFEQGQTLLVGERCGHASIGRGRSSPSCGLRL
jgi:hypothetical protein